MSVAVACDLPENPIAEQEDYRMEALLDVTTLDKLDDDEFTEDEKQEAEKIREERRIEEEEEFQQQQQQQLQQQQQQEVSNGKLTTLHYMQDLVGCSFRMSW